MSSKKILANVVGEGASLIYESSNFIPTVMKGICNGEIKVGKGQPILIIPGFLGDDKSIKHYEVFLKLLGYNASTWGLGENVGSFDEVRDALVQKVKDMYSKFGKQKVTILGFSLGGLYARLLTDFLAGKYIIKIITVASPAKSTLSAGGNNVPAGIPVAIKQRINNVEETFTKSAPLPPSGISMLVLIAERDAVVSQEQSVENYNLLRLQQSKKKSKANRSLDITVLFMRAMGHLGICVSADVLVVALKFINSNRKGKYLIPKTLTA